MAWVSTLGTKSGRFIEILAHAVTVLGKPLRCAFLQPAIRAKFRRRLVTNHPRAICFADIGASAERAITIPFGCPFFGFGQRTAFFTFPRGFFTFPCGSVVAAPSGLAER